jgi:hypothetical protein
MGRQGLNTAAIAIRVEPEIRKAAEAAAKADKRTIAGLTKKLLVDYLEEHGFLPQAGSAPKSQQ